MSDKQEQQENGVKSRTFNFPIEYRDWQWYWRTDENGHADCGVFYEKRPGHAYSVCRAPKYMSKEQWEKIAPLIASAPVLAAQRAALVEALNKARSDMEFHGLDVSYIDEVLRAGGGE